MDKNLRPAAAYEPVQKHKVIPGIPGWLNTLRPRQNGRHFADDIFKCIFLNEKVWIPIKISVKFVPKDPINNIPALLQIMAWRRPGDKPLSEPMMVSLTTHICVTRPQWVNKYNTLGTPYNTNVGVQKIPDHAICKPMVAKGNNNTNPWSCSEPQILVTRDSRQVHMAEQPASLDRLE